MKRYVWSLSMLALLLGYAALAQVESASAVFNGSISGFVYQDTNNNGIKEGGEPGIAGVTITLSGDESDVTTTDANGAYLFILDVTCCVYTVTETQPAGFADGIETVGSGGGGTASNNQFTGISLEGNDWAGYNFGELSGQPTVRSKTHTPTPTATTAPRTSTPTPEARPATAAPQPSATAPGGGTLGAGVRPPDTGTGTGSSPDAGRSGILFGSLALVAAGAVIAGSAAWRRVRRER